MSKLPIVFVEVPGPVQRKNNALHQVTRTYRRPKVIQRSGVYCGLCNYFEFDTNVPANVYFFKFPANEELANQWKEALNITAKQIPENFAVCSLHFSKSSIKIDHLGVSLQKGAVPVSSIKPANASILRAVIRGKTTTITESKGSAPLVASSSTPVKTTISNSSTRPIAQQSLVKNTAVTGSSNLNTSTSTGALPRSTTSAESKRSWSTSFENTPDETALMREREEEVIKMLKASVAKALKKKRYHEHVFKVKEKQLEDLTTCLNQIGDSIGLTNFSKRIFSTKITETLGPKFTLLINEAQSEYLLAKLDRLEKGGNVEISNSARKGFSENINMEQINIEIVDDDSNVLKQSKFNIKADNEADIFTSVFSSDVPERIKTEKEIFFRQKIRQLGEIENVKIKKIEELKALLEHKSKIIDDLNTEIANEAMTDETILEAQDGVKKVEVYSESE